MSSPRPLVVVAGIGSGAGTGGSTARLFSKAGYRVALIARSAGSLDKLVAELNESGGEAAGFLAKSYSYEDMTAAFAPILTHAWPKGGATELRVVLHNMGFASRGPFFSVTAEQLRDMTDVNVHGAFALARAAVEAFQKNALDARGKRGTLIFTGATGSLRGNVTTSAFSAGKFALRSLSQSLSKEFGKENIHVAHAIIDGPIKTPLVRGWLPAEMTKDWDTNPDIRLDPDSIANSYMYLANQDRSAWTWELDLRAAHEKW